MDMILIGSIVLGLIILFVLFMILRKKKGVNKKTDKQHIHDWRFMYNYKDGVVDYGKFYCTKCLSQGVSYFHSREGHIQITIYNSEDITNKLGEKK